MRRPRANILLLITLGGSLLVAVGLWSWSHVPEGRARSGAASIRPSVVASERLRDPDRMAVAHEPIPERAQTELIPDVAARTREDAIRSGDHPGHGRQLTVRVIDDDRRPVEGIRIDVRTVITDDQIIGFEAQLATQIDGRVTFADVPRALTSVRCRSHDGFDCPDPVLVVPDDQEIVFELAPADRISGVVVGPDDQPLEGMIVEAAPRSDGGLSDVYGRFAIWAPRGVPVDLTVRGAGRVGAAGNFASHDPDRSRPDRYRGDLRGVIAPRVDLVLRVRQLAYDRTLEVVVLDPESLPLGDVRVSVLPVDFAVDFAVGFGGITDLEGRAVLRDLPDDLVRVRAEDTTTWLSSPYVRLVPGGQSVELQLRRRAIISGLLLDPEGQPLWGDLIRATAPDENTLGAATGAMGQFQLRAAPGVTYEVNRASHRRSAARQRSSARSRWPRDRPAAPLTVSIVRGRDTGTARTPHPTTRGVTNLVPGHTGSASLRHAPPRPLAYDAASHLALQPAHGWCSRLSVCMGVCLSTLAYSLDFFWLSRRYHTARFQPTELEERPNTPVLKNTIEGEGQVSKRIRRRVAKEGSGRTASYSLAAPRPGAAAPRAKWRHSSVVSRQG